MQLPDRSRLPRWARVLTSPWLLSPLLVFTLLIGAFVGYGAYTRSKPTHYNRGGDVFAAGITPDGGPASSPRPSPAASAPTAAAAKKAAMSHRVVNSGTVTQQQQSASSTPATVPGAPETVLPATGAYKLAVKGSENVKFGFVPGCHNSFPTTATMAVSKASGESPTSYNFDLRLYPTQPNRHDERHIYRYTPSGVYLDFEEATVTCSGVKQSSVVNYSPAQLRAPLPLRVGAQWHTHGGDSGRTEDANARVSGTSHITVGGTRYLVYVINTTVKMSGSETGSRTQEWWYAPSLGVPLKWHEHLSGSRSGATYTEDLTCTVTDLP